MEQAETIEVMGVTLSPEESGHTWHGIVSDRTTLMVFGPAWHARLYGGTRERGWSVLMTTRGDGAYIQLQREGATLADAITALRSALNLVTEVRATIGRDLAAMLDAGEVAA